MCVSLRYFNAVGAHPSGCIGENQIQVTNLFPMIGAVLIKKKQVLHVFGTDWETKDGTCSRDYTHVMDIVKAHVLVLDKLQSPGYYCYNLGKGFGFTVKEVVAAWEKHLGYEIPKKYAERRLGDVPERINIPYKAEKELGWKAEFGLEDMVAHSW